MSNRPSESSSPSKSSKLNSRSATPETAQHITSLAASQDFSETPQPNAEPTASTPVIVVTSPRSRNPPVLPRETDHQSRTSEQIHSTTTPSPTQSPRSQSPSTSIRTTTTVAMSSASSSPSGTSTAGSSSGSNPSYQLPYAPFPYPMPANTRGSGQQSGGQGK